MSGCGARGAFGQETSVNACNHPFRSHDTLQHGNRQSFTEIRFSLSVVEA